MHAGDHRAGHTPHQLADRQAEIGFRSGMDDIGDRGRWAQTHSNEARPEIAEKERAMRRIRPLCKLRSISLDQSWKEGVEVKPRFRRTHAAEIVECPHHPGCTEIETGVSSRHSVVERV